MPSNPYKSPKTDTGFGRSSRWTPATRRVVSLSICIFVGVIASQLLAFLFAAADGPESFIFLGMFGVTLGVFGGFLANLLCVDRIPWYYTIVVFGLLMLGLLMIQSPNYSGAAKLISVIAFIQMLATLGVGFLNR